jgi:hypothetical protein
MRDAIQARLLLVVGIDDPPRRLGDVSALQHHLFGFGVLLPARPRLDVHGTELPLLEWIVDAHEEAKLLLFVADGEPVLQQDNARTHQHALEFGNGMEEFLVLLFRAESHHPLDAGAVVPAAVEQDDFSAGQMRGVALKIPLGAFALAGSRQRRDPADPRIEALRDPLDDPALSRRVAALEDDHDLQLMVHDRVLQFH